MLGSKSPLSVVRPVIKVRDSNLYLPVLLRISLRMPVDSYWALMLCTMERWTVSRRLCALHACDLTVSPVFQV